MGTKGELKAIFSNNEPIRVFNFETREMEEYMAAGKEGIANGHGGGDAGIIAALYDYMTDQYKGNSIPTITESCYNHMLVFAAEESRAKDIVVSVEDFIENVK